MMLARTTYQRKLELFGNIIADAISDDLIYEDDMDSDDPLDLDGYLSDLRPRIVDALQEKWGDDLVILDEMGGAA
tara:strand:+ start:1078 stop:1302 length:225 start_codon:yes stop_codon:yes gene_type:complete